MKVLVMAGLVLAAATVPVLAADGIKVTTSVGCDFTIKFRPDLAPKHVAQVAKLAAAGAYDNVVFHRVIEGFMAQTGDVQFGKVGGNLARAGIGGSSEPDLPAEFSKEHFARGVVGMARGQDPNSANSQFYITLVDSGFMDGQYTVWGQVDEQGMTCVDKIKKGDPQTGAVSQPDSMTKVTVQ